jgi:hypothetical protein
VASAKFRWHQNVPHALQITLSNAARDDTQRRAAAVRDQAKINLRVRSHRPSGSASTGLASTIHYVTHQTAAGWTAQVGSDDIRAAWVEQGTGVFGPRKQYIHPRRRTFMVFQSYTPSRRHPGSVIVFATRSKGQPGKHFLKDAARAFRA